MTIEQINDDDEIILGQLTPEQVEELRELEAEWNRRSRACRRHNGRYAKGWDRRVAAAGGEAV